jgi:hypothetical protein
MFTGSRLIPQPNWGYDVAQMDLRRLQPLREVIGRSLQGGLTGMEILQTFFNRRIQPLRRQEVTMWMHPGPSCHDRPFSVELGDTEINTRIRRVLAHGADLNLGSGSIPLRERVDNPWVRLLGPAFSYLCKSSFLNVSSFLCRVSGALAVPHGGPPYLRI